MPLTHKFGDEESKGLKIKQNSWKTNKIIAFFKIKSKKYFKVPTEFS